MSTHYDEETAKELLDYAQAITGCHLSYLVGGDLYVREDILADIVPVDLLKPLPQAACTYLLARETPEVFALIRQRLQVPERALVSFLYHGQNKQGEWIWKVNCRYEEEPFPAIGLDTSREAEGIVIEWYQLECISCHHT